MFQLQITPLGKYSAYRFANADIAFTVIPEGGALLSEFTYGSQPILDSCLTPESVDFNHWGKSWLLFPFPNRLKDGRYEWEGKSYQFPINETQNSHALHGFLHACPFDVVGTETNNAFAEITLRYDYAGEHPYYPFPFIFTIKYHVSAAAELTVTCTVENDGATAFPMGLGWHPYYCLTESVGEVKLLTPPLAMLGVDRRMIPTGKRYEYDYFLEKKAIGAEMLDNCFVATGQSGTKLKTIISNKKISVETWQDATTFPYVQLFTPPARHAIAIEPMTCNIDAFNNQEGLVTLLPGQSWEGSFGFQVQDL